MSFDHEELPVYQEAIVFVAWVGQVRMGVQAQPRHFAQVFAAGRSGWPEHARRHSAALEEADV